MINELLTEKNVPIEKVISSLDTYSGDAYTWYDSLEWVHDGWRRSFFGKYLPLPYHPCLRVLYGKLGENQILSRIAYTIKVDQQKFANNPTAREKSLEMLSSSLQRLEGYKGDVSLSAYINGQIQSTFRDQEDTIKALLDVSFAGSIDKQEKNIDKKLLASVDKDTVYRLFKSLTEVDDIFVTANQSSDFRQYSFLSAYQLWCFEQKVKNLNEQSKNITFSVQEFNKQHGNREHVFITKLFNEIMPLVSQMKGTADIKTLVRILAARLQDVENNTGINIPITFSPAQIEGIWYEEVLHKTLVTKTKRDNFDKLVKAFISLGRLHNILESAGIEFPSFYTDLAKDPCYLFKFSTLNDYIEHSHKVLTIMKDNNLPSNADGFLRHISFETSAIMNHSGSRNFNNLFSLLANYNALISQYLCDTPGDIFSLKNAYEVLAKGYDPLTYLVDNYPERASDFRMKKFEQTASELFPNGVLHENVLLFYRTKQRTEMLPLFIKLYKSFLDVYGYFKRLVGIPKTMTNRTGSISGIRVTDAEFSVIVAEHEKLAKLSQMTADVPVNSIEFLSRIAAILIDDEEKAPLLIQFLAEAPIEFFPHWEHIQQNMVYMFKVSQESDDILFGFGKSDNIPPIVPDSLARKFKNLVDVKLSTRQTQTMQAVIEKQGYRKDMYGFLMTSGGLYLTEFFAGQIYFKHTDGYSITSNLEIKIWGDS